MTAIAAFLERLAALLRPTPSPAPPELLIEPVVRVLFSRRMPAPVLSKADGVLGVALGNPDAAYFFGCYQKTADTKWRQ